LQPHGVQFKKKPGKPGGQAAKAPAPSAKGAQKVENVAEPGAAGATHGLADQTDPRAQEAMSKFNAMFDVIVGQLDTVPSTMDMAHEQFGSLISGGKDGGKTPKADEPAKDSATDDTADKKDTDDGNPTGQQARRRKRAAKRGPVQKKTSGSSELSGDEVMSVAADGVSGSGVLLPFYDQIQRSFGRHDVSGVRAHVGDSASRANQAMGSLAYASGTNVAFGGTPDLHTAAHEAAHVVQQRSGVQLKDGVGSDGDEFEQHADAVADKVVAGGSAEALLDRYSGGSTTMSTGVQHKKGSTPPPPPPMAIQSGLYDGPKFLNVHASLNCRQAIEAVKTTMHNSMKDMAKPSLDEVDTAYEALMSAHDPSAQKLAQSVARASNQQLSMSTDMRQDFGELRDKIGEINKAGKALKEVAQSLEGHKDLMAGLVTQSNALKQEYDNAKKQEKLDEKKAEQEKNKANAETTKKIVGFVIDNLKDAASAKNWKEFGIAFAFNAVKAGMEIAIDQMYKDPSLDEAITNLEGQLKGQAAKVAYAKTGAVNQLKSAATSLKSEALMKHKHKNQEIARSQKGMSRLMTHLQDYQKASGADAVIAEIFVNIESHQTTVKPLAHAVLAAIKKAIKSKPTQGAGRHLDSIGQRDEAPMPFEAPPDSYAEDDDLAWISGEISWGRMLSELGKFRAQAKRQWQRRVEDKHKNKVLADYDRTRDEREQSLQEGTLSDEFKTADKAHQAARETYDQTEGIQDYEQKKHEYDAFIKNLNDIEAWLNKARTWYDMEQTYAPDEHKTDPEADKIDWKAVEEQLEGKKSFASSGCMSVCKMAMDTVNNYMTRAGDYPAQGGKGNPVPIPWPGGGS